MEGTFDREVLNVSLRSIGACLIFPIFDNLVSLKRLSIERNGLKVSPLGHHHDGTDNALFLALDYCEEERYLASKPPLNEFSRTALHGSTPNFEFVSRDLSSCPLAQKFQSTSHPKSARQKAVVKL